MAVPFLQAAFSVGEVAPSLFGRFDLARLGVAAATVRNMFVSYLGGVYSRAGTKFVGFSKQTGRAYPPRIIPFQFSLNQGLELEFGHHYMRVVKNGAFVLESSVALAAATQANPCNLTTAALFGATGATSNNGAVVNSYAPGDTVTLAGGTFVSPTVLNVVTTTLLGLQPNAPGTGYVPGNTVTLAGGTLVTPPVVTVVTAKVVGLPTVAAAGAGGTPGPVVLTGTTGTGTLFTLNGTINGGGALATVDSILTAGSYTVNPGTPEPVTGGGLAGATVNIVLGINSISITTPGSISANPTGAVFTQASTTGAGVGATFQFGRFGPNTLTVNQPGQYSVYPANPVAQASSSGAGTGATYTVVSALVSPFVAGDWVFVTGVGGMTQLNGQTFIVVGVVGLTFNLTDVYGTPINSTGFGAYTGGGTVARVYTLTVPYAEEDLLYLKFTQSADTMSLCLVNQISNVEYEAVDLARITDSNWTVTSVVTEATINPPTGLTLGASAGGSLSYAYTVTSTDPSNGSESIAATPAYINGAVNVAATAGTITVSWTPVANATVYRIYKATPGFGAQPPVGALYGFAGYSYGTQFFDTNIIADLSIVPPLHNNPFARGIIEACNPVAGGAGYTSATATITTSTGTSAVVEAIIVGGAVVGYLVQNPGRNYAATDTVTITGTGAGATASLKIGPQTGTYPGVVTYFQERRGYGYTINTPDTYFFSQPGSFKNFDAAIPTVSDDAIIGAPWAVQVNGIQWMIPMPGGLVVLTGLAAYQLTGTGGSSFNPQPIGPDTQQVQPQAFGGSSDTVPPIKIENEIIYVQSRDNRVRDLSYQFYTNIYTGSDLTLNSAHLFVDYVVREWTWAEEPFKTIWAVRGDGAALTLTFVKSQEVAGWARHDTNGLFKSVSSVIEQSVNFQTNLDAVYFAVQRNIGSHTAYTIERMDDRQWTARENTWCVDCGLAYPQPTPAATLTASSSRGLGALTGVSNLVSDANWSAGTTATVVDNNGRGPGTGAVVALTIVAGTITNITFSTPGAGYVSPQLVFDDPANGGGTASADITLNNSATFTASAAVFSAPNVGSVIRMGGGIATITAFTNTTHVTANITQPIVQLIPNTGGTPQPQASGAWTMTAPTSSVTGLQHLAGATVTGLYDGNVLPPVVVPISGTVPLPAPATMVILGLAFTAQLQSIYGNPPGNPTQQGQRKAIEAATARVEASGAFEMGSNQIDGSTLVPLQTEVVWNAASGMTPAPVNSTPPYGSTQQPLYTGDVRIPVIGGYANMGQVAVQQTNPQPLNVLAFIPEELPGDIPELNEPKQREPKQKGGG